MIIVCGVIVGRAKWKVLKLGREEYYFSLISSPLLPLAELRLEPILKFKCLHGIISVIFLFFYCLVFERYYYMISIMLYVMQDVNWNSYVVLRVKIWMKSWRNKIRLTVLAERSRLLKWYDYLPLIGKTWKWYSLPN